MASARGKPRPVVAVSGANAPQPGIAVMEAPAEAESVAIPNTVTRFTRLSGEAVLCAWDTVEIGQPVWDLAAMEAHCRRFGHGDRHHSAFAEAYGWHVGAR
ncbi:hypothetical protein [Streptomyces sp. NPDC056061]|uniref:hypothetical protein n=1 Tax=Streptomyces sp. NPDC056061 TaxID=3345700 RepID=UPI0035DA828E